LTHKEEDCFCDNEEEDSSLIGMPLLSTRQRSEEDSSDEESDSEDEPPPLKELTRDSGRFGPRRSGTPPNMDATFEWDAIESGVMHVLTSSLILPRVGMTRMM
jgi:hypothetical protein